VAAPKINVPLELTAQVASAGQGRLSSDSCARIKELGFTASRHIKMYGERFEIVSDPIAEGDCVVVQAISGTDLKIRTLHLPVAILVGWADRFLKIAKSTEQ
jgi:hypothetical protein